MPSTRKRSSSKRKMNFDIHPIRSESDYLRALAEIKALMDAKPNTPEEGRLDVLGTLVDVYEREHFPIEMPDPVEAIKFRMEQMGVSRKELEKLLGGRNRVSEVLNRRRSLSLSMIRGLSRRLHIPADVLVREYKLQASKRRPKDSDGRVRG